MTLASAGPCANLHLDSDTTTLASHQWAKIRYLGTDDRLSPTLAYFSVITIVFGRVHHNVAPVAKSAIYDCLVI